MEARISASVETPPPLVTALVAPRLPPAHVRRPRLVERLEQAGPVTLICGPPGAGKTSLLCAWMEQRARREPVAWVSLDPTRDDPSLLWDAVLLALRGVCGDERIAALAPPVRGSNETFMPVLVNALAELPEQTVLVLDDVHVLRSRECLAQLAFLVLHMPPTLRLMLSGRADPPLPLHVPRVLGTLTEIRAQELAFTEDEAAELFAAHPLALDGELVATLWARTEGWAAGLRLAALGLEDRSDPAAFVAEFGGDDRVVADYLVAEVLDRQPARRRAFLLRTSITERISGRLADAITGERTGAATLADLGRTNGFVVGLDPRGDWYRYHALFARLLEVRAQRELGEKLLVLHRRAARWYADEGMVWPALRHSVSGEEWELAARLTVAHGVELIVGGRSGSLGPLIAQLPPERVARDAELSAVVACSLIDAGDAAAAQPYLEAAGRNAAALSPQRLRELAETRAIARLCLARLRGDVHEALADADVLLAGHVGAPGTSRLALLDANLGRAALWAGDVERAARRLADAVSIARVRGLDYLLVGALGHLALLEVSRSGPDEGLPLAEEALDLARCRGWADIPETAAAHLAAAAAALYGHRLHAAAEHLAAARPREVHLAIVARHLGAQLHAARGELGPALAELAGVKPVDSAWGLADVEPTRARLLIAAGDLGGAEAALERSGSAAGRARLRLADGDPYGALEALAEAKPGVESLLLEALALVALDRPAHAAFEAVLASAEATGHRSALLDAGPALRPLLLDAIRYGTSHRAVVGELLDLLDEREPAPALDMPADPLTGREQAVLRCLPTRLSNREIAGELLISTNTVKTHLRTIYRKLDVTGRREAVERARTLGLLSGQRVTG